MSHQTLPRNWEERELLRERGQFWTPSWVAEAMVAYVANGNAREVFDPAVGAGAFFQAAKNIAPEIGRELGLRGTETDASVLSQALETGLVKNDLANVLLQDFTTFQPREPLAAIVANPPYIRHHRLTSDVKSRLKQSSTRLLGFSLDGRAGYHVYFLVHALSLLAEYGRLAFILPADTCEGVFAPKLWNWIASRYRLEAVITFEPQASPFPRVDTNAVIVLIKNAKPHETLQWTRVRASSPNDLKRWILSDFECDAPQTLFTCTRSVVEALRTGLSRLPQTDSSDGPILGDYAKVLRGIATGANEFFFLTRQQVVGKQIPSRYLLPAIGRTRDVESEIVNEATLRVLEARGRPTLLLSIDGTPQHLLPTPLQNYLREGEQQNIHERALIQTRRPWYKMETRDVPPFLFAYLGRRNTRFIRNQAGVVPLTGFLCVYPHQSDEQFVEKLWQVLRHPETVENLSKIGKSYGSGAIKVEPRALEKLPLPLDIVQQVGLPNTKLF